jgi:uncharacterized protein
MRGSTIQWVSRQERLRLAQRAAAYLRTRGATHVWLFGSLARGRAQDERSDIDLAVQGLPRAVYYSTVSELDQLLGCPVDLVELETAPPALRREIERWGVVLAHEG